MRELYMITPQGATYEYTMHTPETAAEIKPRSASGIVRATMRDLEGDKRYDFVMTEKYGFAFFPDHVVQEDTTTLKDPLSFIDEQRKNGLIHYAFIDPLTKALIVHYAPFNDIYYPVQVENGEQISTKLVIDDEQYQARLGIPLPGKEIIFDFLYSDNSATIKNALEPMLSLTSL